MRVLVLSCCVCCCFEFIFFLVLSYVFFIRFKIISLVIRSIYGVEEVFKVYEE